MIRGPGRASFQIIRCTSFGISGDFVNVSRGGIAGDETLEDIVLVDGAAEPGLPALAR
jgi:hypothetical protein